MIYRNGIYITVLVVYLFLLYIRDIHHSDYNTVGLAVLLPIKCLSAEVPIV